jgi:hypothetical protein
MPNHKLAGDMGENEVCDLVPCPNCGKKLMLLPPSFPLCDVQCTACHFRAQVKTSTEGKTRNWVRGAGWDIVDKVMKSGYLLPPLIGNFKWMENGKQKQEIRFYPFITRSNLRKRQLPPTAQRANCWMYDYVSLDKIPHFVLYKN